jgi:hypothetical protein
MTAAMQSRKIDRDGNKERLDVLPLGSSSHKTSPDYHISTRVLEKGCQYVEEGSYAYSLKSWLQKGALHRFCMFGNLLPFRNK